MRATLVRTGGPGQEAVLIIAGREYSVRDGFSWSAAHSQVLVQLWAADAVPRHRLWACEVARLFPRQEFREIVLRLEDDPDGHVRRAAREASEKLGGPTTGCS